MIDKEIILHEVLLTVLLTLVFSVTTFSQGTGKLRGFVSDSSSGEALAYANIYIKNLGVGSSTDSKGYFIISSLPPGKDYIAEVSYVGYKKQIIFFRIIKNKITNINIALVPLDYEMATIEKNAAVIYGENVTSIGIQKLSSRKIVNLPKGVEADVFRSLQYLPGIQAANDVSASFHVRGGATNENLFLLDDMPVYNPFHALGLFGSIDPEVVKNMELHLGGFGPKFSGRLSSIIKLITKDGNKNKFKASVTGSLMSVKTSLQGPFKGGSYIVSGRKSYSNRILNNFLSEENFPIKFYDLFFKVNYANKNIIENGKFSLEAFFSGDDIINQNPLLPNAKWSNNVIGLSWFQFIDTPLFYTVNFSVSNFNGKLIPRASNEKPIKNTVVDYTGKFDLSYVYDNKDELGVGFIVKEVTTDLFLTNGLGQKSNIGHVGEGVNATLSLYAKYKFLRLDNFALDVGTRVNMVGLSYGGQNRYLEPRISLSYNILPTLAYKAAWGIYQQEITTFTDEDVVINYFEPWIVHPSYLKPAQAIHYISGFEWNYSGSLSLNIEGYYKTMINLPVLNERKVFIDDNDFVEGSSKAYGVDFLLNYKHPIFTFSTSFSHGYVNKKVEDKTYTPRYDIRNSFKAILELNIYQGWKASATWVYYSGIPFTLLAGYYDKLHFDNRPDKFSLLGSQIIVPLLAERNAARLPAYHRLDLNVSKKFNLSFIKMYLSFSIINLYDRANIFYFDRNTGKRVNMLPFLPTVVVKAEL